MNGSSKQLLVPLDLTELDDVARNESPFERLGKWIPFLGWMVANSVYKCRVYPVREKLLTALANRPNNTLDTWEGDFAYRNCVETVLKIAGNEIGWPHPRFIPDDGLRVVFWAFDDGLDDVATFMEIEDTLGIEITEKELAQFQTQSIDHFIRFVYQRKRERESC